MDSPNSTLFVWGFSNMEYKNYDTTDIPEIDLNIFVAVQPYQFEPLDRDSSSGTGSDSASAESDEECSRPSVKSSKQIIVRCEYSLNWKHYMVRTVRTVRTFDISCRYTVSRCEPSADEWRHCQTQKS